MAEAADKLVVAGGYGAVGREAAGALAAALPGRVVVAGRDAARASACAAAIGHGAEGRRLDVRDPGDALWDAALVLMCTDPPDVELARRCLAAGVHYVDVTADGDRLAALRGLDEVARDGGATAAVSVGLAPGVTNLLAAHVVRALPAPPERLDLLVLVGLGEAHGPAAIAWTIGELARAGAMRRHTRFELPGRTRPVRAFSFGFPEGRSLPETLGLGEATSWFAAEPAVATVAVAAAVRMGLGRVLRHDVGKRLALRVLGAAAVGPDMCTVAARAGGRQATLAGRNEARLTGLVAADVARRLVEAPAPPGAHHVEQLFEPRDVLERLAAAEPSVTLTL